MARLAATERRRLLLEAAARVVARDGLAETTTRAITDEAAMPRGTFHYCFRSKDELLEELVSHHVKNMVDAACAVWADERPQAANLRDGLRAILGVGTANPGEEVFTYELTVYALRKQSSAIAENQYADYARQAVDYLAFAADRAGSRWSLPMPALARLFTGIVDGCMLNWLADHNTEATYAALDAFADLLASLAEPVRTEFEPSRPKDAAAT